MISFVSCNKDDKSDNGGTQTVGARLSAVWEENRGSEGQVHLAHNVIVLWKMNLFNLTSRLP